jgi:hypothetical protein
LKTKSISRIEFYGIFDLSDKLTVDIFFLTTPADLSRQCSRAAR